jgi:hypothetical protein
VCYTGRPLEGESTCESCKTKRKAANRSLKMEVVSAYGGACQCCGEANPLFLTIDHTHGDGASHRRGLFGRNSGTIYRWLKKMGFPMDGFQLLCFNCNCGKNFNGGTCPHKTHGHTEPV